MAAALGGGADSVNRKPLLIARIGKRPVPLGAKFKALVGGHSLGEVEVAVRLALDRKGRPSPCEDRASRICWYALFARRNWRAVKAELDRAKAEGRSLVEERLPIVVERSDGWRKIA
jgi:hypothetical protein